MRRKVRRKGKKLCERADWNPVSRPIEMRESVGQGRQIYGTRQIHPNKAPHTWDDLSLSIESSTYP